MLAQLDNDGLSGVGVGVGDGVGVGVGDSVGDGDGLGDVNGLLDCVSFWENRCSSLRNFLESGLIDLPDF